MKAVKRIHTCIVRREVIDFIVHHAASYLSPGENGTVTQEFDFMTLPPPDRLINQRVVTPAHPLPDGSIMTRIEVTALEDEEPTP